MRRRCWAIGATLYLLLTDRLPFEMPANVSWASKNLFDKPVSPPSETNPDVNHALDAIVMKTLEKKADNRYPTARELLSALENLKPASHESAQKSKTLSSEQSKALLGTPSPANQGIAKDLVQKALKARQTGRLADAADLMEEAFNKSPRVAPEICPSSETLALRDNHVTDKSCPPRDKVKHPNPRANEIR